MNFKINLCSIMLPLLIQSILISNIFAQDETPAWMDYENNPIISVGESGSWDAGALGSMSVVNVNNTFHMYYEAWGLRTDSEWDREEYNTLQIGHATSTDGLIWTKDLANNPVIRKGEMGEWDSHGTWDPFVIYEDEVFKMWYGGNNPDCNWGYAESDDGSDFVKKGKISDLGEVEDVHVVHDLEADKYYMYYWDRHYEPMGLFRAVSKNETDFDFNNAVPISIENDYEEMMYKFTHVIKDGKRWYMFYADFVRPHCDNSKTRLAMSADGINWKSYNKHLFNGHDTEILSVGEFLTYAFYGPSGYFDRKDCDIRLKILIGDYWDMW